MPVMNHYPADRFIEFFLQLFRWKLTELFFQRTLSELLRFSVQKILVLRCKLRFLLLKLEGLFSQKLILILILQLYCFCILLIFLV